MRFCPYCGRPTIGSDATFCGGCGRALPDASPDGLEPDDARSLLILALTLFALVSVAIGLSASRQDDDWTSTTVEDLRTVSPSPALELQYVDPDWASVEIERRFLAEVGLDVATECPAWIEGRPVQS